MSSSSDQQADVYPPDFSTERGQVRSLISDVEQVDFSGEGAPSYLFSDAHIDAYLSLYSDKSPRSRIKRATADARSAIAMSEALISKVITTEDLETDGSKVAAVFLNSAKQLREDADKDDEAAEEDYGFEVVDFQPYPLDGLTGLRGFPDGVGGITNSIGDVGVGEPHHGSGFGRWV